MAIATRPDSAPDSRLKKRAAAISLAYNVALTLLKLAAALLSGSVSLLSEATHSATDVLASAVALVSVRAASAPPDDEHPYGHGKIESLAGFGESILLLLIAGYVGFESIRRLFQGRNLENLEFGIWVMAISAVSSYFVARHVRSVADLTGSLALQSNSQHLMMDCVTSIGVLAALSITKLTGWQHADPLFALAFVVWMSFGAWKLAKQAYDQLIDRRLTDEEHNEIKSLVESQDGILGHHRLRTRLGGDTRYVDMHVVVPENWSVTQAHEVADVLEKRIADKFAPAVVVIHVDPYDPAKDREKSADNLG